jgi:hypothetical protein
VYASSWLLIGMAELRRQSRLPDFLERTGAQLHLGRMLRWMDRASFLGNNFPLEPMFELQNVLRPRNSLFALPNSLLVSNFRHFCPLGAGFERRSRPAIFQFPYWHGGDGFEWLQRPVRTMSFEHRAHGRNRRRLVCWEFQLFGFGLVDPVLSAIFTTAKRSFEKISGSR